MCNNPPPISDDETCDGEGEESETCQTDCYGITYKLINLTYKIIIDKDNSYHLSINYLESNSHK